MKNLYFFGLLLLTNTSILFGIAEKQANGTLQRNRTMQQRYQGLVNRVNTPIGRQVESSVIFKLGEREYKALYDDAINRDEVKKLKEEFSDDTTYKKNLCATCSVKYKETYINAAKKLSFFPRIYFLYIRPYIPYKFMK